ncbi:MAG: RNA methyltransferase [Rhodothermaceae bacterium]|nr:RNA methyltransferase [Rhodothermaceae bacterium]
MEPKGKLSLAKATLVRKLHLKKHRDEFGLFIAEGNRVVEQILVNRRIAVEFVVVREDVEGRSISGLGSGSGSDSGSGSGSNSRLDSDSDSGSDTDIYEAGHSLFEELATTENPQNMFAVCRTPMPADAGELLKGDGVILALYQMSDPGNLGTILRSAAWFGTRGVFLSTGTVDLYNPKVVRSMAGSTGSLPVASGFLAIFLEQAKKAGWRIFLLDAGENSKQLSAIRPGKRSVLVLGSEAHGLPQPIKDAYTCVKIESAGDTPHVESLNASVSASIALYQLSGHLRDFGASRTK